MHDAVRRERLARRGGLVSRNRRSRSPLLTVLVPFFDVERYLPDCLGSLRAQPLYGAGQVEVLLVDDGSRDGSGRIAAEFAASQPRGRVRLLRQANAGLGAARNAALQHVRTPYLTFMDSDDTLPADAWSRMLQVVQETGSAMVVGKMVRLHGQKRTTGRWMEFNHRRELRRTTVEQTPEILADVFAVNKIFRRDFWEAANLRFVEGILYEDQPTLTRAMLRADSIDVVPDVVYHWRTRGDGTSITDGRRDLRDIRDRVATKVDSLAMVRAYAHGRGQHELTQAFLTKVLPVDMWEYFRGAIGNSEDYWSILHECMRTIWQDIPFHASVVPVQQRLMGWLVEHDRRADLEHFLRWYDRTPSPERVRDGCLQHPFRHEAGLPAEVTHLRHPDRLAMAI